MNRYKNSRHRTAPRVEVKKIPFFILACAFISFVIIARLFQLQVLAHDYYQDIATQSQYGFIELPAQRGEILIRDFHSGETSLLATNTTLNLLYADPALVKDSGFVGRTLAPILFDLEKERQKDTEKINEISRNLGPELSEEEIEELLTPKTDQELEEEFKQNLIDKIGQKQRQEILLATDMEPTDANRIKSLGLSGIEIDEDYNVRAYPPQIFNPQSTAELLADYIQIPSKKLNTLLKGENRYVQIQRKLSPNQSDQIKELFSSDEEELFTGVGLQEEFFRFYPEGSLAANIVGYVSHDNIGQYGIESTFNTQLSGQAGKFQTKRDSIGRQITVGESVLEPAIDGDNIVLTIDRSIQLEIEKILDHAVWAYQADSAQAIVMNPQTGAIIAMAHAPTFDPNNFGEAFKKVEVNLNPDEIEQLFPTNDEGVYYFYKNPITLDRYLIFEEKLEDGRTRYLRYENFVGPEVYHNKIVSWPYEPGSVFKTIAMASAIDDGDITPNTTYNDEGPIGVDWNVYKEDYDFFIKNSENEYYGLINMQTVLGKSLNTGMTFIAKKMGPALYYSYLDRFGFLDRTDIEFDSEVPGKIKYFDTWTESELATHSFGQGMTVTMVQLANAYSSVINGGILMQPHIVSEVQHDNDRITKTAPTQVRRVISEDTSSKMITMLTNSTESGVAKLAQVPGHYVGGKTGTSQTYKHGQALSGKGTTITSFAGFGPVDEPQFVILVKFDRPKANEWGSQTAAPTFSKIAEFLFDYYNIPPDKAITTNLNPSGEEATTE